MIDELKNLIPAPKKKFGSGTPREWKEIQDKLQIQLPQDLYDLFDAYGAGHFCDFNEIEIGCPFFKGHPDYIIRRTKTLSAYGYPYPIYPSRPGLFPLGACANGHELFWLTEGDAEDWPVILNFSRSHDFLRFDMTLTEFLAKALAGKSKASPWKCTESSLKFHPKRP